MTENRVLPLQGIHNFRDYGGYRTRSGAFVPRGRLYRSGHLSYATQSDIDQISDIALDLIVDLRSDKERKTDPSLIAPIDGGRVAFVADSDAETPHLSAAFKGLANRDEAIAVMTRIYTELPFNPDNRRSFGLFLNDLAECQTASLVHCFAGKDRTGLAVALFHHIIGVSDQDIYEDYLLTNVAGEKRLSSGIAQLRTKYDLDVSNEVLQEAMMVRSEYLDAAFFTMCQRFGSINEYVVSGLDVSQNTIEQLQSRYCQ
jgi:protein-tyrosine phosphatase